MKLLLIDDDPLSLGTLQRTLMMLGFTCEAFENPQEALEAFGDGGNYNAVLTDLKMPEMNGLQVILEMRRRQPDVRIFLITGFDDQGAQIHQARQLTDGIFRKPVDILTLLSRLDGFGIRPSEKSQGGRAVRASV